jgi:hypothetical protein
VDVPRTRPPSGNEGGPPKRHHLKAEAAAASARGAAPAAANCDPDYFLDAEGGKHFKPECFGKKP